MLVVLLWLKWQNPSTNLISSFAFIYPPFSSSPHPLFPLFNVSYYLSDLQRFAMAIWKPSSASSSACPATNSSSSRLSGRTPSPLSHPQPSPRAHIPHWASRAAPRPSSASLRMGLLPSQPRKQHRPRCSPGEAPGRCQQPVHANSGNWKYSKCNLETEWMGVSLYSSLSWCLSCSNPSFCHIYLPVHTFCHL